MPEIGHFLFVFAALATLLPVANRCMGSIDAGVLFCIESFSWARLCLATLATGAWPVGLCNPALTGSSDVASITSAGGDVSEQALLKKLDAMEQRIKSLEAQLKRKAAAPKAPDKNASAAKSASESTSAPNKPQPAAAAPSKRIQENPPAQPAPADQAVPSAPAASAEQAGGTGEKKADEKTGDEAILGIADSPLPGLAIGAYGEVHYGYMQNPAAGADLPRPPEALARAIRRVILA